MYKKNTGEQKTCNVICNNSDGKNNTNSFTLVKSCISKVWSLCVNKII